MKKVFITLSLALLCSTSFISALTKVLERAQEQMVFSKDVAKKELYKMQNRYNELAERLKKDPTNQAIREELDTIAGAMNRVRQQLMPALSVSAPSFSAMQPIILKKMR